MRTGWLTLPEGRIETAWWGPGPEAAPTIVLLHEGLGCVALWRDVPEHLAARTGLGVFAYSRHGYGQSDPVTLPRPMTYMHNEAQVVLPLVLAQAGVRDAVLVGHSDGGSIAAIYAGTAGRRSTSPAVSWPGLSRPPTTSDAAGRRRGWLASARHDGSPNLRILITIAAHFFVEDLNIASIRAIKAAYETGDLRDRLSRYHRDPDIAFYGWNGAWLDPRFRGFDITGYLPTVAVPTLGLQGADDPYGSDQQLHAMRAHITAPVETVLIPAARHSLHLEAKEATLETITRFIAATVRHPVP
ncbi:MAG TPA: alpha/beta hydrolase [Rhodopila sp.]|uniref:alpha/beta fold hydrolase n=1 Tax=Rhodopila sp. TaxID=2480087 RepID=UPI002B97375A|nr:alpha/beta hydrolase [Rhodopila sp.]HVY14046.1 alpha/beta hydrolase [Rhodopila sp.]